MDGDLSPVRIDLIEEDIMMEFLEWFGEVNWLFLKQNAGQHTAMITWGAGFLLSLVLVDLVSGVYKSIKNKKKIVSSRLRDTGNKTAIYLVIYIILAQLDMMACTILPIPIFCLGCVIVCGGVELKSIFESAEDKAKIEQQKNTVRVVLEKTNEIPGLPGIISQVLFQLLKDADSGQPAENKDELIKKLVEQLEQANRKQGNDVTQ